MPRWFAPGLLLSLAFVGCTGSSKPGPGTTSTVVREEGSAIVVIKDGAGMSGIRFPGPELNSTEGMVLNIDTPWEFISPQMYLVPAGTVVFGLQMGPLLGGDYKFGFHAKAGEAYDLRIDEIGPPMRVTVIEVRTGRVATTRGRPKRTWEGPGPTSQTFDE